MIEKMDFNNRKLSSHVNTRYLVTKSPLNNKTNDFKSNSFSTLTTSRYVNTLNR